MKTDNPSLGETKCNACLSSASIKRKRTGRKMLYLHCKNCGLDQRSGEIMQQKWQSIIDGIELTSEELEKKAKLQRNDTEISTESVSEIGTEITELSSENWQPKKVIENDNSSATTRTNEREQESSEQGIGIVSIIGAIFSVALVIAKAKQ